MEIRQLYYVLEVAKCLNFSKAANALYISQSNISQQIRALETELGTTLFIRDHHNVELTKKGEIFCEYAREIVKLVDEMRDEISPESLAKQAKLSVAVYPFFHSTGMNSLIIGFHKLNKGALITSKVVDVYEGNDGLDDGTIDFALMKLRPEDKLSRFNYILLKQEELLALLSGNHPMAGKDRITAEDLSELPLLTGSTYTYLHNVMKNLYDSMGAKMTIAFMNTSEIGLLTEMLVDGEGVSFATEAVAKTLKERGVVSIPTEMPVEFNTYLVYSKKLEMSRIRRQFKDFIIQTFKDDENK